MKRERGGGYLLERFLELAVPGVGGRLLRRWGRVGEAGATVELAVPALAGLLAPGRAEGRVPVLVGFIQMVRETPDFQEFGRLEQGRQPELGHVDLPAVYELEDRVHLRGRDVAHDDHRVLGRGLVEDSLEVSTAGRQHDSVGPEAASLAGEGHVDKLLLLEQVLEKVLQALEVAVPAQAQEAVLLARSSGVSSSSDLGLRHGGCFELGPGEMITSENDRSCMGGFFTIGAVSLLLCPPFSRFVKTIEKKRFTGHRGFICKSKSNSSCFSFVTGPS